MTTTLPGESMTSTPTDSGINVRLFIQNISEFLIGWNPMIIIQMLVLRITLFKEIRGNFACGIRNPESGKFLFVESRINQGIGSRNTARGIRSTQFVHEPLESGIEVLLRKTRRIHSVQSSIQYCLGLPYMGELRR